MQQDIDRVSLSMFPRAHQSANVIRRLSNLIHHLVPEHQPMPAVHSQRGYNHQNFRQHPQSLNYKNTINRRQNALVPVYYENNNEFLRMVVSNYYSNLHSFSSW